MDKEKNKALVVLVIIIAIVIGVIAFIGVINLSKSIVKNLETKAIEESKKTRGKQLYISYLEEKYGSDKKFEFIDGQGGGFGNYDNVATIKSNDLDETFTVRAGSGRIKGDTYIATKYKKEMNNIIMEIANNIFGKSVVFHSPYEILSQTLTVNSSFEEYCKEAQISATIVVSEDSYNETQIPTLAKKIQELGIGATIRFIAINRQKYDNSLDLIQIDEMLVTEDCKHFVYIDIDFDDISINIDYNGAKHY